MPWLHYKKPFEFSTFIFPVEKYLMHRGCTAWDRNYHEYHEQKCRCKGFREWKHEVVIIIIKRQRITKAENRKKIQYKINVLHIEFNDLDSILFDI